jgi:GT2 family glycosyltransferase
MTENGAGTMSAVVCTHDQRRWDAMTRAVESLRTQTRPPDEIVLVVDHNDALLERIRTELPDLVVLPNEQRRGLSGARNTGIAAAKGSFVAFLDDDAAAMPDWLERLEVLCARPGVIGVGGRVVPRWLSDRPPWFPEEFLWVVGCTYRGLPAEPAQVRNIYGGCFAIRRDVLTEIGGFRTELGRGASKGMGCEETELCIRATQRFEEAIFLYDPDAVIEHDVPADRGTWTYFRRRCFGEGVSKAILTKMVGARRGLASERAYSSRILPLGFARESARGLRKRESAPLLRGAAIVAGLTTTALGYAYGRLRNRGTDPSIG